MARIQVRAGRDTYRVRLQGLLRAKDLGRLERACGRALERDRVPLVLDTTALTGMDETARAFVERLKRRGAELVER